MATLDGYIRVSKKGQREGPSYISPKVQEQAIRRWAADHGYKIGKVIPEENVSGAKNPRDRALEDLVARCESGQSDGIIVYRLDRLSRNTRHTLDVLERLQACGARLVGAAEGIGGGDDDQELLITLLSGIARDNWKRYQANFKVAVTDALDRGIHISGPVPAGYTREKGQPLKLIPSAKPIIKRAFKMRADGASWLQIADYLSESGLKSSRGGIRWSKQGAYALIHNRVYLGEARGGLPGVAKAGAHEACVTEAEFAAAQEKDGVYAKRDGSISMQALFGGIITCGGCGERLSVTGSPSRRRISERSGRRWRCPACDTWTSSRTACPSCGSKLADDGVAITRREASYFCVKHRASGTCPEPAAARANVVDSYVVSRLMEYDDARLEELEVDVAAEDQAYLDLQEAEAAMAAYLQASVAITDPTMLRQGIEARQREIDKAQARVERIERAQRATKYRSVDLMTIRVMDKTPDDLHTMPGNAVLVGDDGKGGFGGVGYVWNDPEVPIDVQREHIRRFVSGVVLHRADPARRRWQPIGERVEIQLVGESA
jgi:site-specific DNA recombinase